MASIEMKEYLKSLSVEDLDEWEQRSVIKSAYTAIYETSKSWLMLLVILSNLLIVAPPNYDYEAFATARKKFTKFREKNSTELTRIRKRDRCS